MNQEWLNDTQPDEEVTKYKTKNYYQNYKRFSELVNHNFANEMFEKNVGEEARTFWIMNRSKPLLSPSRIIHIFNEHNFFVLGKKVLRARLLGQLIHRFLELRIMTKNIIKLDKENLEEYVGEDYDYILNNWNEQVIETFIEEVNVGVSKIYQYLKEKEINVLMCEKHICNSEYHGFVDICAYKKFNNQWRKPMIIDLKITTKKEISNAWKLQLAIYRHLFENTAQCYILFYNRDIQECRLEKVSWKEMETLFNSVDFLVQKLRGE